MKYAGKPARIALATILALGGMGLAARAVVRCEGNSEVGFCTVAGGAPVASWSRGPTGTEITYGLVDVITYNGLNAGITITIGPVCVGWEYRGDIGPFLGCD